MTRAMLLAELLPDVAAVPPDDIETWLAAQAKAEAKRTAGLGEGQGAATAGRDAPKPTASPALGGAVRTSRAPSPESRAPARHPMAEDGAPQPIDLGGGTQ